MFSIVSPLYTSSLSLPRGQGELIPSSYYIQLGGVRVSPLLPFYTNNVEYSGMSQGFRFFDVNKLYFRYKLGKETKIQFTLSSSDSVICLTTRCKVEEECAWCGLMASVIQLLSFSFSI